MPFKRIYLSSILKQVFFLFKCKPLWKQSIYKNLEGLIRKMVKQKIVMYRVQSTSVTLGQSYWPHWKTWQYRSEIEWLKNNTELPKLYNFLLTLLLLILNTQLKLEALYFIKLLLPAVIISADYLQYISGNWSKGTHLIAEKHNKNNIYNIYKHRNNIDYLENSNYCCN